MWCVLFQRCVLSLGCSPPAGKQQLCLCQMKKKVKESNKVHHSAYLTSMSFATWLKTECTFVKSWSKWCGCEVKWQMPLTSMQEFGKVMYRWKENRRLMLWIFYGAMYCSRVNICEGFIKVDDRLSHRVVFCWAFLYLYCPSTCWK